jgi:hypothetical protein
MRRATLILVAAAALAGCQKDVKEVRRTDADKYAVSTGGKYSAGAFDQGTPAAPRLEPKALGPSNPRERQY